jgi:hypothetical protein
MAPLLGEAILFEGRTARPWFELAPAVEAKATPTPIAPAVLLLLDLAALAALARAIVQDVRRRASTRPEAAVVALK